MQFSGNFKGKTPDFEQMLGAGPPDQNPGSAPGNVRSGQEMWVFHNLMAHMRDYQYQSGECKDPTGPSEILGISASLAWILDPRHVVDPGC